MTRSLSAAVVAVFLAGAVTGAAEARSHARVHTVTSVETLSQIAGSTSERPGALLALGDGDAAAPEQPYAIPATTREELEKVEATSTMPKNGDLAMWGASESQPASHFAQPTSHLKKADQLRRFASGIISRTSHIALSLTRSAMRFIGTPYVFGGTSPSGFDCSGYTQHVFAMLGIALPRTADAQFYAGRPTVGGLTTGDLVFFQTYEPGPSHVGIYIGHGRFIHSSSHGVMISPLSASLLGLTLSRSEARRESPLIASRRTNVALAWCEGYVFLSSKGPA